MKTLGLLGGMKGGLHPAPCIMYSFDFARIEALQHAGEWAIEEVDRDQERQEDMLDNEMAKA